VNGGLVFDYPQVLTGALVIIPLSGFLSPAWRRIRGSLPEPLKRKLSASRLFFCLFLAFLITAAAGPRYAAPVKTDPPTATPQAAGAAAQTAGNNGRAVDVVIAVDVSKSMLANDGAPAGGSADGVTRLKRGTSIAAKAVAALPGARFAVAVSRNRGIVAVPLTWDDGAVLAFLETVDGSSLTGRGTNLESLLEAGAGAFRPSFPSKRVILLVSDGEALTGSIKNALAYCASNDITVTSILTGGDAGAPVPGGAGPDGEEIISRRDAAVMKTAAGQTGGIFIDANREDAEDVLIRYLRSLSPETGNRGNGETDRELRSLFLLLAIASYGASKLCLLDFRRKKGGALYE